MLAGPTENRKSEPEPVRHRDRHRGFAGRVAGGLSDVSLILRKANHRRRRGPGIHSRRTAITALFLGIQCSIPLSLGLLGALSFVRFPDAGKRFCRDRFPVAAWIASSIGIATGTYAIVILCLRRR